MSTELHYPKAPIIEAIIDLRVVPVEEFDVERFASLHQILGEGTRKEKISLNQLQFSIEVEQDSTLPTTRYQERTEGFKFTQSDEHQVVQARLDGFTFRRSAPYGHWQDFRDAARKAWDQYASLYPFESIVRVALRTINRIDMPFDEDENGIQSADTHEYLNVSPMFPFRYPIQMNGFFLQMQFWQADLECDLIINQAIVPSPILDVGSVILDFDLFKERFENPWISTDEAQIWEYLEQLRVRKNELFQESITSKFKEMIR